MRENRPYGSEGGEQRYCSPTPIGLCAHSAPPLCLDPGLRRDDNVVESPKFKAFARLQPKRRIYGRQPSTVNLALVEGLEINVVPSKALAAAARESLLDLCSQAYQEDFTAYLQLLSPAVHVCGWLDESLVSHAAWVDRLLYVDDTTV